MRKRPEPDHPGGLIDAPETYLQNCTGHSWYRESHYRTGGDFALPQSSYEPRRGRPSQNCTPAAAVNALGCYRGRFPQIPDDPQACYRLLRPHIRLVQTPLPCIGGYPAILNAVMIRRLWRLLGIDAWPAVYPFPSAATLRRETEQGIPLLLSIWSSAYRSHTVLLLGWELWTDGRTHRLLWVLRDGWRSEPRWLDADSCCIFQAIRLAR